MDLVVTRQKNVVKFTLDKYTPILGKILFDLSIEFYSRSSFKLDPAWRIAPAPSLAHHQPLITDDLVDSLRAGSVTSVHGIQRFIGENKIELSDGTILEDVDTVILCTGYMPDFSVTPDFDPLSPTSTDESFTKAGLKTPPLAHLYQNMFPPRYADSLAYFNYLALTDGALTAIDLASMALAQIWNGNSPLPSVAEMEAAVKTHHKWVRKQGNGINVYTGIVRPGPWYAFLNEAAGTGVDEYLGYGLKGWKFQFNDWKLCSLMMKGVMTPHMYRLFDMGKRRPWDGAREAIIKSNEHAKIFRK